MRRRMIAVYKKFIIGFERVCHPANFWLRSFQKLCGIPYSYNRSAVSGLGDTGYFPEASQQKNSGMTRLNSVIAYVLLISLTSLFSCESVIEVDLNESDPHIVIEALLKEGSQDFEVKISQTTSYFESAGRVNIEDATVILKTSGGDETEIPRTGSGIYSAPFSATANETYTLEVQSGGQTYLATSFLPAQVPIQSLLIEFQEATPFFDEGYNVLCSFQDPQDTPNYYRVLHKVDGEAQRKSEDFQVIDDRIIDGNEVELPLFGQVFDTGQQVEVELRSIDEQAYDYYTSLGDIIGATAGPGGGSAAPGNPVSNWTGDALGYFIAYSSDQLDILVE